MLEKLTIWQRVVLLVIIAVVGMLSLISLTLFRLHELDQHTRILSQQISAGRMSQRIIVRAQEIRAHLLLGLQHNPEMPDIMALHVHNIDIHLEKVDTARKELEAAIVRLKEIKAGLGDLVDAEEKAGIARIEVAVRVFLQQAVQPMREKLVSGDFHGGAMLVIQQIQPAYNALKEVASQEADRIEKQGIAAGEQTSAQLDRVNLVVIAGGILILLLSAVASWRVARSLSQQIGGEPQQGIRLMQQASSGQLDLQVSAPENSMLGSLGVMLRSLRGMIQKIRSGASSLRESADVINQSVFAISGATESQASATSGVASAIEELTVSINHIADSIHATEQQAAHSAQQAASGERQVQQAVQLMHNVSQQLSQTSTQIRTLDTRSHEISSIAAVIKDIADQTNLLALNAAIEAARAGESGRGFAVVADEVRKLAERTATATGDIEKMIGSIQVETAAAVNMMEQALPDVAQSVELVTATRQELEAILGSSEAISVQVRDIASATREQGMASTSIAQQVEHIAQSAEKTSAAAQTAAQTVAAVQQQAVVLDGEAARFVV